MHRAYLQRSNQADSCTLPKLPMDEERLRNAVSVSLVIDNPSRAASLNPRKILAALNKTHQVSFILRRVIALTTTVMIPEDFRAIGYMNTYHNLS